MVLHVKEILGSWDCSANRMSVLKELNKLDIWSHVNNLPLKKTPMNVFPELAN